MPNFDDIRPYNVDEVQTAIKSVLDDMYFPWLVNKLAPDKSFNEVKKEFLQIKSIQEFQETISFPVIKRIIGDSITEFTCSGAESLPNEHKTCCDFGISTDSRACS